MSRHFSIPKILRVTPNILLRDFFESLGCQLLSLDWRKLKERQVEPLMTAIRWLPRSDQDKIESSLADIFELACESGIQAIHDAARNHVAPNVIADLGDGGCLYAKSMWAWLRYPAVFESALLIQQVDGLSRWRKRRGLPKVEPRMSTEALFEFGQALSEFLRREEGRGDRCTVEYYRRSDGTDYFVAYPDDFVHTIIAHDEDGDLSPRSIRPTFEIVFAYHRDEGTLDLFAKIPSTSKPRLENLFGQIILGCDIGPDASALPYDLNRLKDRYFCLETDPEDRISASICKLRLDVPECARFTVEPIRNGKSRDVYQAIDECLDAEKVAWDEVSISMATFCFRFDSRCGRRGGSLSFDVTYPDRCSINSRRPERIELTRKYLKRWRIANV